jgi:hypothetical protein
MPRGRTAGGMKADDHGSDSGRRRSTGHSGMMFSLPEPPRLSFITQATRRAMPLQLLGRPSVAFQQRRQLCHVGGDVPGFVLGESSATPVEQIDFHFAAVRVQPPVSHMAAALVPTFCSLYCTLHALFATDHNTLLEALCA